MSRYQVCYISETPNIIPGQRHLLNACSGIDFLVSNKPQSIKASQAKANNSIINKGCRWRRLRLRRERRDGRNISLNPEHHIQCHRCVDYQSFLCLKKSILGTTSTVASHLKSMAISSAKVGSSGLSSGESSREFWTSCQSRLRVSQDTQLLFFVGTTGSGRSPCM